MQGGRNISRPRVALAIAGASLLGLIFQVGVATAAPNPLKRGPHKVSRVVYEAGSIALTIPQFGSPPASFDQPLQGDVTYPRGKGRFPVLLFLHGRHSTCVSEDGTEFVPEPDDPNLTCEDIVGPGGHPIQTQIRSNQGYRYLASLMASHGYVVISPSANVIVSYDSWAKDGGNRAREQVVGATLDLLRRWNRKPGPVEPGRPGHTIGKKLNGHLKLSRVGLMGHSRGGDGVTQFIAFNKGRHVVYPLQGVVALAPTRTTELNPFRRGGTNLAEVLPACDGDVYDLEGGHTYEEVTHQRKGGSFAKVQWLVEGANHNYFNTVWTEDDSALGMSTDLDSACGARRRTSIRLTAPEERRAGITLMSTFLRRFVGNEQRFSGLISRSSLPRKTCPRNPKAVCRTLVRTSYVPPGGHLLRLIGPSRPRPTRRNALGGAIRAHKLDLGWCDPTPINFIKIKRRCPGGQGSDESEINRSSTPQLVITWGQRSLLRALIPRKRRNVGRYRNLVMRAVVTRAARNPSAGGQRMNLVLVDHSGNAASVPAERNSSALRTPFGDRVSQLILSDIRVPLKRFKRVDLTDLRSVEIHFGVRGRKRGQVQIADLGFEGRVGKVARGSQAPADGLEMAGPQPGPDTAIDALPLAGTGLVAPGSCLDGTRPAVSVTGSPANSGGRLTVSGTADPGGCGSIERVQVAVVRRHGGDCAFLSASGRLAESPDCGHPFSFIATGADAWSIDLRTRDQLRGARMLVSAIDDGGRIVTQATALPSIPD